MISWGGGHMTSIHIKVDGVRMHDSFRSCTCARERVCIIQFSLNKSRQQTWQAGIQLYPVYSLISVLSCCLPQQPLAQKPNVPYPGEVLVPEIKWTNFEHCICLCIWQNRSVILLADKKHKTEACSTEWCKCEATGSKVYLCGGRNGKGSKADSSPTHLSLLTLNHFHSHGIPSSGTAAPWCGSTAENLWNRVRNSVFSNYGVFQKIYGYQNYITLKGVVNIQSQYLHLHKYISFFNAKLSILSPQILTHVYKEKGLCLTIKEKILLSS